MPLIDQDTLERIYKSSLKFLEQLTPYETLATIVGEAVRLVNGNYGSILLDRDKELVRVYASDPKAYQTQIRKKGNTYTCFKKGKPLLDTIKKMQEAHPELKESGIQSTIFIPLTNRQRSIGVLTVNSKLNQEFTPYQMRILQLFGAMASLAIRKTQLYDEIKNALDMRDMFISMASHELRTPLTTINGYVQLLSTRMSTESAITKTWMEELSKEVDRLTILVKELLEINRIKSGNLQYFFKESSITEIVNRALKNIEFGHPEKKIELENLLGKDDVVVCDFDKLLQVINNILENAAKYTPIGKSIKLVLTKRNKQLIIQLKDKGIGIPAKDLPDIFKGYVQGANHTKEGLGLGLFLSKNIVEKHLGSIKIKSKENKGTTVEIALPKARLSNS